MRVGKTCYGVFQVDVIALVNRGRGDAAAGDRSGDATRGALGDRRRGKKFIGQLLQEIFVRQTAQLA